MRPPLQALLLIGALAGLCGGTLPLRAVQVLSYHNDSVSSGVNPSETVLTPFDLTVNTFQKLYATPVDARIYAQPLYVPGVIVTGGAQAGRHDLVIVGTQYDSLYAIDASSGVIVWQDSFLVTGLPGATTITPEPESDSNDVNTAPWIGILGTPVIDPATNLLYVVVKTKQILNGVTATPNFVYSLYKIDITNGNATPNANFVSHTDIGDTLYDGTTYTYRTNTNPAAAQDPFVFGTGDGAITVNGQKRVYFNALREMNRSALILVNGIVYACFAAPSDYNPFHGWIIGFNKSTLAITSACNFTPNGERGGIWSAGGCPVVDANQNIYLSTGNGTFDGNISGTSVTGMNAQGFPVNGDYGDCFLKLAVDPTTTPASQSANGWGMKVVDYFAPSNNQSLTNLDLDIAGGGITLLPDSAGSTAHPHLMVGAGKQGNIYLMDRDSMGKYTTSDKIVQSQLAIGPSFDSPAFFNSTLYYVGEKDNGKAFSIANGIMSTNPVKTPDVTGQRGSTPSISANGSSNGVVWTFDFDSIQLRAYAASNFANEIWTSALAPNNRDQTGTGVKFAVPTVAGGRVFLGTLNALVAYGLNPAVVVITSGAPTTSGSTGTSYSFTFTTAGTPAPTFTLTSGQLPPGLTLSPSGVLTGTPTTAGTYSGTVTASNGVLTSATQNFTITISLSGSDTPTMPLWGLAVLAVLLLIIISLARDRLPRLSMWGL